MTKDSIIEDIRKRYEVETKKIPTKPGCWETLEVTIFKLEQEDKKSKIGSYSRNYSNLYNTFVPFTRHGKDFALYSPDYTSTRIMELPSCKDIGGEERNSNGFCPVDFYVPLYRELTSSMSLPGLEEKQSFKVWLIDDECFDKEELDDADKTDPVTSCDFGFIAGCVWGDDTSWKIQFLDLSEVHKGILKRDERFGYIHLPEKIPLKDAIDMRDWEPDIPRIRIAHSTWWDYKKKESFD